MLREQRLALINGGVLEESTIEQLYYESMNAFDDVDFYTESVGDAVETAFEKLKNLINKIRESIRNFFTKFRKDAKNMEINPDVEVNQKELTKLQKFLKACKKVITMPFKKLGKMLKEHKKGAIVGAGIIAAISAFSIGAIVTKKKNDDIRKRNAAIRRGNENAKKLNYEISHADEIMAKADAEYKKYTVASDNAKKDVEKTKKEIKELESALSATDDIMETFNNATLSIAKNNISKLDKQYDDIKKRANLEEKLIGKKKKLQELEDKKSGYYKKAVEAQGRYIVSASQKDTMKGKRPFSYDSEIPLVQNFYTELAGKLGNVSNTLQSGLTKLRRPKRS